MGGLELDNEDVMDRMEKEEGNKEGENRDEGMKGAMFEGYREQREIASDDDNNEDDDDDDEYGDENNEDDECRQ